MRRIALVALVSLLSHARAQTISPVVLEGDPVATFGTVTLISSFDVNDSGQWIVRVQTNDPVVGSALLDNDGPVAFIGDPIPNHAFATIAGLAPARIDDRGRRVQVASLGGFSAPSPIQSSVLLNGLRVLFPGLGVNAPGLASGTLWSSPFVRVWVNGADQVLVAGWVDEPPGTSSTRAFVRLTIDDAGTIVDETLVWKEGGALTGGVVQTPGFASFEAALNDAGQALGVIHFQDAATGDAIFLDQTLIAQEGSPSPVAGRNWQQLDNLPLDLNDVGDFVFRGELDGSPVDDNVIVKNNTTIVARSNSGLPAISPFIFSSFGFGSPVLVDNEGEVLFYGNWNDAQNVDSGLFKGGRLIVQEGVTTIGGVVLESLFFFPDAFAMSDSGRWVLFRATLTGGTEGIFLMDLLASPDTFCDGDGECTSCPCGNESPTGTHGGCRNSAGRSALLWTSGDASVTSDTLRFELRGANANTFSVLSSGDDRLPVGGACPAGSGVALLSDGLDCIGGALRHHGTRGTDSAGDVGRTNAGWGGVDGPAAGLAAQGGFVAGQTRHFHAAYREEVAAGCGNGRNSTNGVSVTFLP